MPFFTYLVNEATVCFWTWEQLYLDVWNLAQDAHTVILAGGDGKVRLFRFLLPKHIQEPFRMENGLRVLAAYCSTVSGASGSFSSPSQIRS